MNSNITCILCGSSEWQITELMDDLHDIGTCIRCNHKQSLREKVEIEHLYTPKDVKRIRDYFIEKQSGIDPILKEPFKETIALDHCHSSQHVRGALNRNSNAFEGKVVNAYVRCLKWLTDKPLSEILRNLADYYEKDYSSNPLHPAWIKRVCIEFNKLPEGEKNKVLQEMGAPTGNNSSERKKFFRGMILTKKFTYARIFQMLKQKGEGCG